ncbi:MAG: thermonuclease family protein [Dehalococcoidia bacterium]|nr:thermonuclease family protein [Dehalococcoidia bacterium]
MKTKYLSVILILLLIIYAIGCAAPAAPQVTRVIDGDTIEVDISGKIYKVRYIGIDTPELDDKRPEFNALAQEATRYNKKLLEKRTVRLEKDISETDRYGRLLRYVYVGDIFVNAELVRQGLAEVKAYPPDTKYQDTLEKAEAEAKQDKKGLWDSSIPLPPPPTEVQNIQITQIFYDGQVPRVESDEYVEITNLGEQPQDLAGWILQDISEGYPSFIFPSYILASGESTRVYTNEYHPEWGGFSFESSRAIWNNSEPDIAALYNSQGEEISRKSY